MYALCNLWNYIATANLQVHYYDYNQCKTGYTCLIQSCSTCYNLHILHAALNMPFVYMYNGMHTELTCDFLESNPTGIKHMTLYGGL